MPTAISRTYTIEGFAIAADGRKQNSEDGSILSDSTQKIFLVNQPGVSVVYSIAGTVGITPRNSAEILFDVYLESSRAIESVGIRNSKAKTLYDYAELFAEEVYDRLHGVLEKQPDAHLGEEAYQFRGEDRGGGFSIVQIWFDGYFKGVASSAKVEFFHVDRKLSAEISNPLPLADGPECYGSERVLRLLKDDPRFADYRLPHQDWGSVTLSGAVNCSRILIAAQMSGSGVF